MTAYFDTDKALLGDFVDSSKFEIITMAAAEDILVGKGVMLDDQILPPKADNLGREYNNGVFVLERPMIGVAFRDKNLITSEGNILKYRGKKAVSVITEGRVYVEVRTGLQVYDQQPATINVQGEFGSDLGELIVGRWVSSGLGGTDLVALELDNTKQKSMA